MNEAYVTGDSTGVSTGLDQTALGKIETGFVRQNVVMSAADKVVLRRLAEQVAGIASSPDMIERRQLWLTHNSLGQTRPLVFCDPENGWNEIITEAQMQCSGKLARRWEMDLRKEVFWGEEMGDDKPVEPLFVVPYTVAADDWGLQTVYHQSGMPGGAQTWDGPVQDYERDLSKLQAPSVQIDWETTNDCLAVAEDVFGGVLDVQLRGTWWWSLGLTLPAVMLRGLTNLLMDFAAQPDELKALLAFISDAHMQKLDYLEREGLLTSNNDGTYVGSGGFGFTDELPQENLDGRVGCADMWGFAESQETVCVSPEMYAEYVFPYEKPILDRFGLNCYGCCEPIDPRWDTVRQHRNLRRVSCSPWADYEKMAELLGGQYVFSMKPDPAAISQHAIDEEDIRTGLRRDLDVTRGCVVEIIMKDNHTIGNRPRNVTEWCRIAKEEAHRVAGE
ncbi:MAG: hypothetical protein QGH15_14250 [Kiritimatiellia bacterium]|jgi:hypothetical protein|nr:hypothetical protein [Kiritimatiellia bacterium]